MYFHAGKKYRFVELSGSLRVGGGKKAKNLLCRVTERRNLIHPYPTHTMSSAMYICTHTTVNPDRTAFLMGHHAELTSAKGGLGTTAWRDEGAQAPDTGNDEGRGGRKISFYPFDIFMTRKMKEGICSLSQAKRVGRVFFLYKVPFLRYKLTSYRRYTPRPVYIHIYSYTRVILVVQGKG